MEREDNWGREDTLTNRVSELSKKIDNIQDLVEIMNCKLDLMLAKQNEMLCFLIDNKV